MRPNYFGQGKKTVIKGVFLFVLLIIVKGPDSFSEEQLITGKTGKMSVSKNNTCSLTIQGKTFSLFIAEPNRKHSKKSSKPDNINTKPSLDINAKGNLSADNLTSFLTRFNPALDPGYAFRIASIYIEEANDEGINSDVAFSQMCLETAFLKYGGNVLPQQHNYCGLGVTGGGVRGLSFSDERAGIRAHIQHLKAYASSHSLTNPVVDIRFRYVKRGSAPNVHKLTGKWATDKNYGTKIKNLLEKMYAMN